VGSPLPEGVDVGDPRFTHVSSRALELGRGGVQSPAAAARVLGRADRRGYGDRRAGAAPAERAERRASDGGGLRGGDRRGLALPPRTRGPGLPGARPPRTQLETQRQITKAGLEGPVCSGGSAYQTKLGSSPPLWTRQARRVFSRERADGDTLTSSESDMLLTLAAPLIMRVDLPEFDARILAYLMRQDKDAERHSKRTARGTRHEARS